MMPNPYKPRMETEQFEIPIYVNVGENIMEGFQLTINYDPSVFHIVSAVMDGKYRLIIHTFVGKYRTQCFFFTFKCQIF